MAASLASADSPWTRGHRTIAVAIAGSLAIHVIALFVLPRFQSRPQRAEPAPLVAHLVQARPTPEPPPAPRAKPVPLPEPARAAPQPSRKPAMRAAAAREVPLRPPAAVAPVPESAAAPLAEAPRPAALPPAVPATVALAPPAVAVRAQPAGPPPTESAEASALAKYRVAIISAARRYRSYPRGAIDNGWEGRVDVRLSIDPSGAQSAIGIEHASGHAILDEAALDMIRRASPLAVIPAALRGRAFTIDLPVLFNLKDELR